MKILVAGATGFIGVAICERFQALGHSITGVGRCAGHPLLGRLPFQYISADTTLPGEWQEQISQADVVINLVGEPILQRWNKTNRRHIWRSRIDTTKNVVSALHSGQRLFNFSATGFYGNRGATVLDESSLPGSGFLSELCIAWEDATGKVPKDVSVTIGRLGVVIGNGGALQKMLPVFKLGMGGRLGDGHQWFPWIHLDDIVGSIAFLICKRDCSGIFNMVAPSQVTNRSFTKALGTALEVPTVAMVPQMVLSLLFGDASSVLLDSQRVVPQRLLQMGYDFKYDNIQTALEKTVA